MLTLKKTLPALAVILAFAAHSVTAAELKTSEERESYSMGASVANYIAAQIMKQEALGVKTDKKLVLQGFNDALQNKSKISVDDIIKELNKRQDVLNKLEEKAVEKARAKNAADGKAYLEKNAKKKGVVTTESGGAVHCLRRTVFTSARGGPRKSSDGTCGGFHPCAFSRRLRGSGPFFGLGHP